MTQAVTQDEQIDTFLRYWTFPNSNRKAAKAELHRIIEGAVQAALAQDCQRRRNDALAALAKDIRRWPPRVVVSGESKEISYNFGYGPGG